MPSFNQQIDQRGQFIIAVKVFLPNQNGDDFNKTSQPATYRALVDTGANTCCISEKVVADLKMQPYSQSEMMTAGRPQIVSVYLVNIAVPVTDVEMRPEEQEDGRVVLKPHPVSESSKGLNRTKVSAVPDIGIDRGFDVILGMDMLLHFHITIIAGTIFISI